MRYLMDAIGEDASLFDDMRQPYAITDMGAESTEAIEQAVWSAKEGPSGPKSAISGSHSILVATGEHWLRLSFG